VTKFAGIAVAAVLLVFAWRGSELNVQWPPLPVSAIKVPKPEPELMKLAADVGKILHGGSLRLAINKSDVGKYDGLGEAIDMAFVKANGADVVKVDEKVRRNLVVACGVLSWTFSIHGE